MNELSITRDKRFIAAAGMSCLSFFSSCFQSQLFIIIGNTNIHLYDVENTRSDAIYSFEGHRTNVISVGFEKNHRWMYSGSEDGLICIWDIRYKALNFHFISKFL